jgi:transcriptional regulator with XRE-family HTH domain
MTQLELASTLGVGKTTISNYETEYSTPDIETLNKLAQHFNVSIDYLLGRTDDPTPYDKITQFAKDEFRKAVKDDPELSQFWEEFSQRDDLKILFKQAKKLSPAAIKDVVRYMKFIEDEEAREDD